MARLPCAATPSSSYDRFRTPSCSPDRSDASKEAEIKEMTRTAISQGKAGMRVGPAAAKQLLHLLRSSDPNLRISSKKADD